MKRTRWLLMTTLLFGLGQAAHATPQQVVFIVDGSGSMWGSIEGDSKIALAKEAMANLVQQLPDGVQTGLIAYGHRSKDDCQDIEVLLPASNKDHALLRQKLETIIPRGKTPISGALTMAAEQIGTGGEQSSIILLSDGEETCGSDPCALVANLRQQGNTATIHVVGLDVAEGEGQQLQCIAQAGGGRYFPVSNAQQLQEALDAASADSEPAAIEGQAPPQPAQAAATSPKVKRLSLTQPKLTIENLNEAKVYVCAVSEEPQCNSISTGYAGSIDSDSPSLDLAAGSYRLGFENYTYGPIEVMDGQDNLVRLGAITIPNLQHTRIDVCAQGSQDPCNSLSTTYAGNLKPKRNTIELPAGSYHLAMENFAFDPIQVQEGQSTEVRLGTITLPNLINNDVNVCSDGSEEICNSIQPTYVGRIKPKENVIEVPAGPYQLAFENYLYGPIQVQAGQDTTISLGTITAIKPEDKTISVCAQGSESPCSSIINGYIGRIDKKRPSLSLPMGSYTLLIVGRNTKDREVGPVEVGAGEVLELEL